MRSLRSVSILLFCLGILSMAAAWQSGIQDSPQKLHPNLRQAAPKFWKGNLHTHSLWSDGDDFPDMIADWYKRNGYHFLGLSDHNVLSEGERWMEVKGKSDRSAALLKYRNRFGDLWVERRQKEGKEQVRLKPMAEFRSLLEEPNRFLLIPAEEITHRFAKNPVHMNAINLRNVITPVDGASVAETVKVNARQVREQRQKTGQKMLVFVNHPNFGWGVKAEDMLAEEVRFFEVYNGHPGVKNYGDAERPGTEKMWDIILSLRLGKHKLPPVFGMGTDDAHNYHVLAVGKSNPGRGWVMVRAPYLSPETIVQALEAGDFYISSGVTLKDLRMEKNQLRLSIQPEPGVSYKTQFIATFRDTPLDSVEPLDKEGKPLDATRRYHSDVGKVVAETDSLEPSYTCTGQEWYVRARIVSSRKHPNPFQQGDYEMAWTQPLVH